MDIDQLLQNLVDLHVHLGSSSTPEFLWETAHAQGIKLPTKDYWKFINSVTITKKTSYDDYLNYFHLTELIQSSAWSVEKSVHSAISLSYRKANITTIEIRFNPMLRNRDDEQDLDKIILAAIVGMRKACLEYPVKAGLILMMDRRFDKKKNNIIIQKAIKFKNDVLAIDIGGPINKDFKIDDIKEGVIEAQKQGLKVTIHTGEVTSSEEMWEVLTKLKPQRIGHGVRAVDDPKLMQYLSEKKIILEICPSSNLQTRAVKNWKEMKNILDTFKKYKVGFTINSDGPVFLKTNVKQELKKLYRYGVLSIKDIQNTIDISRKSTFIKN